MADVKITALTVLTAADPINDAIPIVDVSNPIMAASGTTSRISINNLLSSSPTASGALTVTGLVTAGSATITGAATVGTTLGVTGNLTVDTSTLVVDATNDRVGIRTTSPDAQLDVRSTGTASTYKVTAIIQDTTYPASGYPTLEFKGFIAGNDYRSGVGSIGGQQLAFYIPTTYGVAPTLAMTLNSTANLVLKGGTAAADGVGVTFPAAQVASSDANCLDDYEEGTWSPTPTAPVNLTSVIAYTASYTKVGRLVTIIGAVSATVTSSNLLTYVTLPSLPFANNGTSAGSAQENGNLTVGISQAASSNLYLFFPAASAIVSGAATFYYSVTYSV